MISYHFIYLISIIFHQLLDISSPYGDFGSQYSGELQQKNTLIDHNSNKLGENQVLQNRGVEPMIFLCLFRCSNHTKILTWSVRVKPRHTSRKMYLLCPKTPQFWCFQLFLLRSVQPKLIGKTINKYKSFMLHNGLTSLESKTQAILERCVVPLSYGLCLLLWVWVSLGVHGNGAEARRHVESKTYTCLPAAVFTRHSSLLGFKSEWKDRFYCSVDLTFTPPDMGN